MDLNERMGYGKKKNKFPSPPSFPHKTKKTVTYVPSGANRADLRQRITGAAEAPEKKPKVARPTLRERFGNSESQKVQTEPVSAEYDYEAATGTSSDGAENEDEKNDKRVLNNLFIYRNMLRLAVNLLLAAACIYMLFLTYGVLVTQYVYNEQGVIVPQVLTVEEVREANEFKKILNQYIACRELYQHILVLDYRMEQGYEDPMVLVPEYSALLKDEDNPYDVTDLSIRINALSVKSGYIPIKDMMYNFAFTDAALYLQHISAAISNNDTESANLALTDRDVMYSDFSLLTQNIIAMGAQLRGVNITDVMQWSPDKYIEEYINGEP